MPMRRPALARAGDAPTVATKRDGDQAWRRTQLEAGETSVQLQSTNARTPPKTEEYQRPESKTIQQLAEPDEICKPPPPGSNPGGASNLRSPDRERATVGEPPFARKLVTVAR